MEVPEGRSGDGKGSNIRRITLEGKLRSPNSVFFEASIGYNLNISRFVMSVTISTMGYQWTSSDAPLEYRAASYPLCSTDWVAAGDEARQQLGALMKALGQ